MGGVSRILKKNTQLIQRLRQVQGSFKHDFILNYCYVNIMFCIS